MITASGVQMTPEGDSSPTARDIAVGMCRITRFAGALWVPLAPHSIMVAEFIFRATGSHLGFCYGMLHDAHETVTGELTMHWKPAIMGNIEDLLDARIFRHFNIDVDSYRRSAKTVKEADVKALTAESTLLKYPGWPEFFRLQEGREPPVLSEREWDIADALLRSFWRYPPMVNDGSPQMDRMTKILQLVRLGKYTEARTMALSCDSGLLKDEKAKVTP